MRAFIASFNAFVDKYMYWLHVPNINVIDIVEIVIIAVLLYYLILWVRSTRAWALFKGLLVVLVFLVIAAFFQMTTILWLSAKVLNFAVIALVVIFQPELRRALERLGNQRLLTVLFKFDFQKSNSEERFSEKTVNELVKACVEMSKVKTGAIIALERDILLAEYIRTGINVDAAVSSQLLINIFEHNTPLHDGAVIMRGDRVLAATCYLPLSDSRILSKDLGTRHRAAVGLSEVSDAVILVVSEETGAISMAQSGVLYRNLTQDDLKEQLRTVAQLTQKEKKKKWRLRRNEKN